MICRRRKFAGEEEGVMKALSRITKVLLGEGGILFLILTLIGMAVQYPRVWADGSAESRSLPLTRIYMPESDVPLEAPLETPQTFSASQVLPAQVSIFYPTMGQSGEGLCWQGLRIDSHNNVYPIGSGEISKILPDGKLVNGVNDQNFFASGGLSFWGELDESGGKFYTASGNAVFSAPFLEGSTFSILISGLNDGQAIVLGQGPLVGSLFVSEGANQVSRVTLSPLGVNLFASGTSFFASPEAIASAPDGTLYVVNRGFDPPQLTKISPAGVPTTFLTGTVAQVNRAVIVDDAGNIYWSHASGINKYDASGNLLGTLPGPPDKPAYGNPMGAAFDSSGNLYIVDNFDCKKIYKYTLALLVNDLVTFEPIPSTFHFTPEPTGCPAEFVGKFSFEARLTNISDFALSDLVVEVTALTNGNLLQNADGGPGGVGARLPVPRQDGFSDGVLTSDEFVDVPFLICLREKSPFNFFVDVLGVSGHSATQIILSYLSPNYRFLVVPFGQGSGFEQPGFDDSQFDVGNAAFGTGGFCPLDTTVETAWPLETDILLRKTFTLPANASSVSVAVAIDNDVQVFINGVDVSGGLQENEGCAERDRFVFSVPDRLLIFGGENLLAVRGRDRGVISYIDVEVRADILPF
jgi:hypothetical protein